MLVICTDRSSTDVPFEVYDVSTTYIFVIASEKARIIAANCQNIANTSHIMKKKAINKKEKRSRESEEEERRRREKLLTSSGLTAGRKMSILAVTFSKVQLHQYNF